VNWRLEVGTREIVANVRQNYVQPKRGNGDKTTLDATRVSGGGGFVRRTLVEARAAADANGESLQATAALAEVTAGPTREEIDAQRASVAAACRKSSSTFTARITPCLMVVQTRELAQRPVESNDPIVTLVVS